MNIGYACINMTLGSQKPKITTNRGMIRKTFDAKGLSYVSELVLQNISDLIEIIDWNHSKGIKFYRMSSDMFPWMSEYEFTDLPNYNRIASLLSVVGELAKEYNQRLTFHPGPFNVLCSPNEDVVLKTVKELNKHSQIMDLMGLSTTPYNKINIHIGGVYGDKESALQRWVDNFHLLDKNTKSRLTVENDSNKSQYNVTDLMFIHEHTGIPIVFDYHHHFCYSDGQSPKEDLELAISTWPKGIVPIVHYSESKRLHESIDVKLDAHSTHINSLPNTYNHNVDIMVEAKAKELTILKFL